MAAVEGTFGGLDVLVNNAGVTNRDLKGIIDMSLEAYHRVVDVNQTGVFLGMHMARCHSSGEAAARSSTSPR